MARSKASDSELQPSKMAAARPGGPPPSAGDSQKPGRNGVGNQGANRGGSYGTSDTFDRDWHDDTGTVEPMRTTSDLGPAAALADNLRDTATSAARAVKEQAAAVASRVGHELEKTGDEQIGRGAEAIRGLAGAIDAAGDELEKLSPELARFAHASATRIRDVSSDLSNRQINDLIKGATNFARSQPAIFFGAAVAAGFVLARFLRSSATTEMPADTRLASRDTGLASADIGMTSEEMGMSGRMAHDRFSDSMR